MNLLNLIQIYPKISVISIALVITVFITIVRYFMIDREKMREIRKRQKELREEMKKFKNHPEKMMEINKQMMEDFPEQMKQSFKPMIITIIPIIILFKWMSSIFLETAIASTWLWWYIGASIIFSIILSKVSGLQ